MNKDYYFQHDYNPTTDAKIQAMLSVYGDWGYGLFWRLIEMMHREGDHSILMKRYVFTSFAQHKSTSVEQVEKFVNDCVNEFELFVSDGSKFWSERVNRNIGKREEISVSRSKAGKASAEARKNATSVEQVSTSVEQNPTKESKEKKSKRKVIAATPFAPPSVDEVQAYFLANGYTIESAKRAFRYYDDAGWVDGQGHKVKNWKQKMQGVWFKDENKTIGNSQTHHPNGQRKVVL